VLDHFGSLEVALQGGPFEFLDFFFGRHAYDQVHVFELLFGLFELEGVSDVKTVVTAVRVDPHWLVCGREVLHDYNLEIYNIIYKLLIYGHRG